MCLVFWNGLGSQQMTWLGFGEDFRTAKNLHDSLEGWVNWSYHQVQIINLWVQVLYEGSASISILVLI